MAFRGFWSLGGARFRLAQSHPGKYEIVQILSHLESGTSIYALIAKWPSHGLTRALQSALL